LLGALELLAPLALLDAALFPLEGHAANSAAVGAAQCIGTQVLPSEHSPVHMTGTGGSWDHAGKAHSVIITTVASKTRREARELAFGESRDSIGFLAQRMETPDSTWVRLFGEILHCGIEQITLSR
jgi:hypothetical protein